jgi:DNA-binding NarL/FixJ family response regulator
VAIVEDDVEMGLSVSEILLNAADIEVVATFGSGEEAIEQINDALPDVVLMDLQLPGMSGVECVRQIKQRHPAVHLMMYTGFDNNDNLFQSLTAGASGYLLKRSQPAEVIEAIRDVNGGGSPMSPGIARRVFKYFHKLGSIDAPAVVEKQARLTERETEVLKMLTQGLRYKEIADGLGVSVNTVRTHLYRIYEKLHVTSRTEAVVKYLKNGS